MDVTLQLLLSYWKILLQLHKLYSIEWQDCEWCSIGKNREEGGRDVYCQGFSMARSPVSKL